MAGGEAWIGGVAARVVEFVNVSELRHPFKIEAQEAFTKSMDAPEWIPAGSCERYESGVIEFASQSQVCRGRA